MRYLNILFILLMFSSVIYSCEEKVSQVEVQCIVIKAHRPMVVDGKLVIFVVNEGIYLPLKVADRLAKEGYVTIDATK